MSDRKNPFGANPFAAPQTTEMGAYDLPERPIQGESFQSLQKLQLVIMRLADVLMVNAAVVLCIHLILLLSQLVNYNNTILALSGALTLVMVMLVISGIYFISPRVKQGVWGGLVICFLAIVLLLNESLAGVLTVAVASITFMLGFKLFSLHRNARSWCLRSTWILVPIMPLLAILIWIFLGPKRSSLVFSDEYAEVLKTAYLNSDEITASFGGGVLLGVVVLPLNLLLNMVLLKIYFQVLE